MALIFETPDVTPYIRREVPVKNPDENIQQVGSLRSRINVAKFIPNSSGDINISDE